MDAGLAYATEDRKTYGLVLIDHIKHNVTLANLEGVAGRGVVDDVEELAVANKYRKDLAIRCSSVAFSFWSASSACLRAVISSEMPTRYWGSPASL